MKREKQKLFNYWGYLADLVVVIIGILIALSLNTWRQNRQEIKNGKESLRGIYRDLEIQKERLQFIIYLDSMTVNKGRKLIKLIDNPLFNIDSMEIYSSWLTSGTVYVLMNSYYEALKSTGNIENIKNKDLKELIIRYYEHHNVHESKVTDLKIERQFEFLNDLKQFAQFTNPVDTIKPSLMFIRVINTEKAIHDTHWKSSLYLYIAFSELSMTRIKENLQRVNIIQEMIKKEIKLEKEY